MPIYGINTLQILFSGTIGSISMKVGMTHQRFKLMIYCSNDNPVLISTYFTPRSFCNFGFSMGKCDNDGYFRNYCIL